MNDDDNIDKLKIISIFLIPTSFQDIDSIDISSI